MANRYWVGNGGDWQDNTNHWSASSGGSPGASTPDEFTDNVIFDTNSFSSGGQTVVADGGACLSFDASTASHAFTLDFSSGTDDLTVNGNMTLKAGMSITASGGAGTTILLLINSTLTTNGVSIAQIAEVRVTGTVTLADSLVVGNLIRIVDTLDANGHNVTADTVRLENNSSVMTMGTGTWTILTKIQAVTTSPTVNQGTSTLITPKLQNLGFAGSNNTFYDIAPIGSFDLSTSSSLAFHNFTIAVGGSATFAPSKTTTVTNLIANGNSGSHITFTASGTTTLSASSVSVSYIDVHNNTAAGATPFVDSGGIDNGGNTNWTFPAVAGADNSLFFAGN